MQPTYYVQHPDGTYSVAEPQPKIDVDITLEKLENIFNAEFGLPFLQDKLVDVHFVESMKDKEKTLQIKIGRRDIWINEKGEVTGAGTDIG